MNPRVRLDYRIGEAVYWPIAEQHKYQVANGRLLPGSQLPSIRALAAELSINSRTVVKAYEHLAGEGLVTMRHGQGVFLAENRGGVPAHARKQALLERAKQLLADTAGMAASLGEVRETIERIGHDMGMNDV